MDLDDDELKATRRMNGSDKNVGNIEKLIEELTKVRPDELSKDGLKLFEYINEGEFIKITFEGRDYANNGNEFKLFTIKRRTGV